MNTTPCRVPSHIADLGIGVTLPAGANAYDLACQRRNETRWVTHAHDAAVARLKGVSPRRGCWLFRLF